MTIARLTLHVSPWRELGCDPHGALAPRIRRLDLAADIRSRDPRHGATLLRDLAAVPTTRKQRKRVWSDHYATEHVSGVDILTRAQRGKGVALRAYDKALEQASTAGDAPPRDAGTWVRVERQLRYDAAQRPTAHDALDPAAMQLAWAAPLAALLTPTVHTDEAITRLLAARRLAALTDQDARRLAGWLIVNHDAPTAAGSRATAQRNIAALAGLGIPAPSSCPTSATGRALLLAAHDAWLTIAADPALADLDALLI